MADSPPSSEKRLCPTYFVCRNFSNASASISFLRIYPRSSSVRTARFRVDSIRSMSHCF